jgi:hypothetical protein
MSDDRRWMYDGNKSEPQSYEWYDKTKYFIERVLLLSTISKIRCPCDRYKTQSYLTSSQ